MSKFLAHALYVMAASLLVSCTNGGDIENQGASLKTDSVNNPHEIGVMLHGDADPVLLVGVPKSLTGTVTLCQAQARIDACANATSQTLLKSSDLTDRGIYVTQSAIQPETLGKFFAVEVNSQVVYRMRLSATDGSDDPSPTISPLPTITPLPTVQPTQQPSNVVGDTAGLTAGEIKVIGLINDYRRSLGLSNCTLKATMNQYAQENSQLQQNAGYSGHFTGRGVAEIAFYGPTTAESAFQGWRASPGHDSIMRTGYATCGVSAGSSGYSWTVTML